MITARISGLGMHGQRGILFEYVYDYQGRVDGILSTKPTQERELLLSLFRLLPTERLPDDVQDALAELQRTDVEREEAEDEREEAEDGREETRGLGEKTGAKAEEALAELERAEDKARQEQGGAGDAWRRTGAEVERARDEWRGATETWHWARNEEELARAEWDRAQDAWRRASAEWDRARDEWERALVAHAPALIALHAELCPDCPGDGEPIFPDREDET